MSTGNYEPSTHLPWTKWLQFPRRHFQMHFLEQKIIFDSNFTAIVPKGPINSNTAFVQVMAWRRTGHYLFQCSPSSLTHICGTRGRLVKIIRPILLILTVNSVTSSVSILRTDPPSLILVGSDIPQSFRVKCVFLPASMTAQATPVMMISNIIRYSVILDNRTDRGHTRLPTCHRYSNAHITYCVFWKSARAW